MTDRNPGRSWYLVHSKPNGEAVAEQNLVRQGYEVYLPRLLQYFRRAGRRHQRISALFPRYLFLRVTDGQDALAPVRSTRGVSGIVRFGNDFAIVPELVVHDIRRRADPDTGMHRLAPEPVPGPGARIRVSDGPFEGLEGVFQRRVGQDRVAVLLTVLGRIAPVSLPLEAVVAH